MIRSAKEAFSARLLPTGPLATISDYESFDLTDAHS
jgi:hypothetical protein